MPRAAVDLLEQRGDQLRHGPRARVGAHALQERGQEGVVLHALRERVESVVREHAQRERQVRAGRHELREHDCGARHLGAQIGRVLGIGALGDRGEDLVGELGGVRLVVRLGIGLGSGIGSGLGLGLGLGSGLGLEASKVALLLAACERRGGKQRTEHVRDLAQHTLPPEGGDNHGTVAPG